MKTIDQSAAIFLVIIGMLISACSTPTTANPTVQADSTVVPSEAAAEVTATPEPTQGPAATVWPPVFDPNSLGNIRDQDSFIITINEQNVQPGGSVVRTLTMGYIKEPYAGYFINEYSSGVDKTYVVDGRSYTLTGTGDWYIEERDIDILDQANLPEANTGDLAAAVFVGEEEFEGIPAYHFILEQVKLPDSRYTMEGEFYLAKEGNYVLYSLWRSGTSDSDYFQLTTTFSSINQLSEITLPAEMQEMPAAAEVPIDLALPLPPESEFISMVSYRSTGVLSGIDNFYFTRPGMDETEFLDFYRNLPETDGWNVTHIGFVTKHSQQCADIHECVIINKGSTQVVLALEGSDLVAEFDWNHIFAPIN
jgi:hypothetical protein